MSEKTWKGIKTVSFKIEVTTYISELLNSGADITAPNSALRYENFPELPPGNQCKSQSFSLLSLGRYKGLLRNRLTSSVNFEFFC